MNVDIGNGLVLVTPEKCPVCKCFLCLCDVELDDDEEVDDVPCE